MLSMAGGEVQQGVYVWTYVYVCTEANGGH